MIKLTLLNDTEILININSIKRIERKNSTSIILNNGGEIQVTESPLKVTNLIKDIKSAKISRVSDRQKQG